MKYIYLKLKLLKYLSHRRETDELLSNNDNILIINKSSLLIRELLDLLNQITLFFDKKYLEKHIIKNISVCFNHIFYTFITHKPDIMKVNNKSMYYYRPNFFIKNMLFVYTKINSSILIHILSKCNYINMVYYKKLLNIITKDKCEETHVSFRFKHMIQLIDEQRNKNITKKDIPNKYIDPITCEIMENPLKLPASTMVVDRLTIMNILQDSKLDPYSRTELTEEMLINMQELKDEIDSFIKT